MQIVNQINILKDLGVTQLPWGLGADRSLDVFSVFVFF